MSLFLDIPASQYIHESEHFFMIYDRFPVAPGHILIITNRLCPDYFSLTEAEKIELTLLIDSAKTIIETTHQPDGYNIGMNCGAAAGQTIFHFHCHVIPRYTGDMDDPRGGVRNCIPSKGNYML
jgi:diadenosine tetraphosphate (Ap4A) HIT family hydrolase